MRFTRKLIAIDLETTGSIGSKYSIVQLGAVKLDDNFNIVDTFNMFARPLEKDVEIFAMNVHKIPINDILRSEHIEKVLNEFERWIGKPRDYYLAAWGTNFDINFLREQYKKLNRQYPFSYRCIDLKSIVLYELARRNIRFKYTGLKSICKLMKLPFEGRAHDGLTDAKMSIKLIQHIQKIRGEK